MLVKILLTGFLVLVYFLNKKSSNSHFYKSEKELNNDYALCLSILQNFDFSLDYIKRFKEAYAYFQLHPEEYNGTSVINDRYTIKGLEIQSLIHDFDWIVAKSFKELHRSNIRYANALRKVNVNWIWVWVFLFLGLEIVALFKSVKYLLNKL